MPRRSDPQADSCPSWKLRVTQEQGPSARIDVGRRSCEANTCGIIPRTLWPCLIGGILMDRATEDPTVLIEAPWQEM